jgi:hypothetical protein
LPDGVIVSEETAQFALTSTGIERVLSIERVAQEEQRSSQDARMKLIE